MAKRIQYATHSGTELIEYVDFMPVDYGPGEVQIENKDIGIN